MLHVKTFLQLHLYELQIHLICFLISFSYLFCVSYTFSNQIIYLCINIILEQKLSHYFIFTDLTEKVTTNLMVSFYISLILLFQVLIYQIWFFLQKGFFQYENYKFIKIYIFFIIFNLLLIQFILLTILPNIWIFFTETTFSNIYLFNIYFEPKLNNFFDFIILTFSYIYILFLYFFVLLYIIFNNILILRTIIKLRNFFYLKFLIISFLIAPPDFGNQILIFIGFLFIFEILIFYYLYLFKYFYKKF